MKRVWLEWDGDKATGVWEGRIWTAQAQLHNGRLTSGVMRVALIKGKSRLDLVAKFFDVEHGDRPEWCDILNRDEMGLELVDIFHDLMMEDMMKEMTFSA